MPCQFSRFLCGQFQIQKYRLCGAMKRALSNRLAGVKPAELTDFTAAIVDLLRFGRDQTLSRLNGERQRKKRAKRNRQCRMKQNALQCNARSIKCKYTQTHNVHSAHRRKEEEPGKKKLQHIKCCEKIIQLCAVHINFIQFSYHLLICYVSSN